jgi:hypothetical protein
MDTAFEWLARAAAIKGNSLIQIDPAFDAIRDDPRMARLFPQKMR